MLFLGLHSIDLIIVVAIFAALLLVGLLASRGVHGENDFFVAGRAMGPLLQFFLNFGTMADSNGAPLIATEVYREGAAGSWIGFQTVLLTPFYWFTCVWYRRTRLITGPDQFIERFNSRKLALAFAYWGILSTPLGIALGNIACYKVAAAMFVKPPADYTPTERKQVAEFAELGKLRAGFNSGQLQGTPLARFHLLDDLSKRGQLPSSISMIHAVPFYLAYTLIVTGYITLGGIKAAAYADALQGILIVIFSFLMVPIGLARVHGFAGLHAAVPQYKFDLLGSAALSDYTWYSIAAFVLLGLVSQPVPQGCGAGRNESAIRIGTLAGAFGKRFVMIAWLLCGLLAIALYPGGIADPDNTWGVLSHDLLKPGLLGIMIAAILLGHMPSVGSAAVNFAAMFTRNIYEPLFPGRSAGHYMLIAKLSIPCSLGAGVVLSLFFGEIVTIFITIISIAAFFGALGFLMLFWRGLTARAAGAGWILWMVLLIAIPWGVPLVPALRRLPALTQQTLARTTHAMARASAEDVTAGRATAIGQPIDQISMTAPTAMFFESVASFDSQNPTATEGVGRFHLENYLLHLAGVPLERMTSAGLITCRWLVDSIGPFIVLIALSFLLPDHPKITPPPSDTPEPLSPPAEYARLIMQGNIAMLYREDETPAQAHLRLERYFAKLKTPVAPTAQEDEHRLADSFAAPERYDHTKLFRFSPFEFCKWDRADVLGFFGCWVGAIAVFGILRLVLSLGS